MAPADRRAPVLALAVLAVAVLGGCASVAEATPPPQGTMYATPVTTIPAGEPGNLSGQSHAIAHVGHPGSDSGIPVPDELPDQSGVPMVYWVEPGQTFAVIRYNHECPASEPTSMSGDGAGEVIIGYTRPAVEEDYACDAALGTVTDVFAVPDNSVDQMLHLRIGFAGFSFWFDLDPDDASGVFDPVPAPGETP